MLRERFSAFNRKISEYKWSNWMHVCSLCVFIGWFVGDKKECHITFTMISRWFQPLGSATFMDMGMLHVYLSNGLKLVLESALAEIHLYCVGKSCLHWFVRIKYICFRQSLSMHTNAHQAITCCWFFFSLSIYPNERESNEQKFGKFQVRLTTKSSN